MNLPGGRSLPEDMRGDMRLLKVAVPGAERFRTLRTAPSGGSRRGKDSRKALGGRTGGE